ncbi:MAG TPA: ABC transporter permease [Candidatus Saccharimonadales bacterium]|nr:ABC transporter permease [Candidatus Saccharimonadales bacterium]
MIPALKSEFRKLLSVRSTYGLTAFALLIVMFFAGFIEGFRNKAPYFQTSTLLQSESTSAIAFVGFILAFTGLLLMGHEYRYNTVMYSLTSANRRLKVLAAKFLVVLTFGVVTSLIVTFFSPLCTILGAALHGYHIGPQHFDYFAIIWRCVACGVAYALYALILVTIMRNQIGAIVTFLLLPLMGENILGLLLKKNVIYLPFTAAQDVVLPQGNHTSSLHALGVVAVYVAVGAIVSAALFVKRDAN